MTESFEDSLAGLNMIEGTREIRASFKALREALVEDGWSEPVAEHVAGEALAAVLRGGIAAAMADAVGDMLRRKP